MIVKYSRIVELLREKTKKGVSMSNSKVQVRLPVMLSADSLRELPLNSQRQSRHEFSQLRESIRNNGFDESLLVRPVDDGAYEIIAGNHRYRAGKAEGMTEFPCVVREDWDDVRGEIESVRRNYVRGHIDKAAFSAQVDHLVKQAEMPLDVVYESMGFEDAEAFGKYYEKQKEAEKKLAESVEASSSSSAAVKILDDLGTVLSTILATHGHTVPNSFIIFPVGGKNHAYVATTPGLKNIFQAVATQAIAQGIDINIALCGLLQMGAAQSGFLQGDGGVEVNEEGRKNKDGDPDLEFV